MKDYNQELNKLDAAYLKALEPYKEAVHDTGAVVENLRQAGYDKGHKAAFDTAWTSAQTAYTNAFNALQDARVRLHEEKEAAQTTVQERARKAFDAARRFEDACEELTLYAENTASLYPDRLRRVARMQADIDAGKPIVKADGSYPQTYYFGWFRDAAEMYRAELGPSEYRFTSRVIGRCAENFARDEHNAILNGEYKEA